MDNIIKSFHFEAEGIELILYIRKEIFRTGLKMFIEADVMYDNVDINSERTLNGTSKDLNLIYKNKSIFWVSSNNWKGLRWGSYKNESGILFYNNVAQMKEQYVIMRGFVTLISNYFYESVKKYKELKLLYETSIDEIVID